VDTAYHRTGNVVGIEIIGSGTAERLTGIRFGVGGNLITTRVPYCSMLYTILYYDMLYCTNLYYTILNCTALYYTIALCAVLYLSAVCFTL